MSYVVPREKPTECRYCLFMDRISYDCRLMYKNDYPDFKSQYENCPLQSLSKIEDEMTDEMKTREEAICKAAKVNSIGEVSDGFHTFNGLYEQRMILFAALVKAYKDKAWKSYRHEDGEYCFGGGWFIVGIDTPKGSYTYHYENKYWDMFDCVDLPRGKHWDGHTEADAETRLMSLNPESPWISVEQALPQIGEYVLCETTTRYFGKYHVCKFVDKDKVIDKPHFDWGRNGFPHVITWMPLPESFEG